ncbi:MAG: MotA/TolQ/ExbB proton channel family protein [Bacteroidetes bacterium]|nr:MotA/TolQ/ExbB proton channel family protein [Bacteroidota bacterium]
MFAYFMMIQATSGQEVPDVVLPTSFLDIIEYAQGFEWPLGALFFIGLFILVSAYVRQFRQWRGSRALMKIDTSNLTVDEFSIAIEKDSPPNNPFRVIGGKLLEEFHRGGTAQTMIDYAYRHIDLDHEKYKETDRYITAAVYIALSLGLLGTLLGIFVLFMSGSRHEASDLVGLGIAVVSTMLALVVRLILWPLNVYLQASLRRRYTSLRKWTVAFAYALSTYSSNSRL